ncbi:hypothetical protein BGX31_009316 [Mortierella sp. GBA43]|nr:hypothetical protein BGX31_009316 [Mortierella sp. GBA43]
MGSKPDRKQKPSEHPASPMVTGDKVLSKEEEEEMSSALIAQLLAQEGGGDHLGYYAEYNNDANYSSLADGDYSDDDDDYRNDYSYRPKSRSRRGGRPGRKRAKHAPAPPKPTPSTASATVTSVATAESTTKNDSMDAVIVTSISTTEQEATGSADVIKDEAVKPDEAPVAAPDTSITPTVPTTPTVVAEPAPVITAAPAAPVDPVTPATPATPAIAADIAVPEAPSDHTTSAVPEAASTTPAAPTVPPAPKRRPKEMTSGMNTGTYTEREERAFVEALELFGRNWRMVEDHVATRDANSIRSHAQKHFIKLFRDNTPLPPRVLETGPGYTLSGNDLNPFSSAARPYLSPQQLEDPSLLPAQGGTRFTPDSCALAKAEKALAKERKAFESLASAERAKDMVKTAVKDMQELKMQAPRPVREPRERARRNVSPPEPVYSGRTDYSKARLRTARERTSISFRQMAGDLDPLTMVKCEPFCGQPNSGVLGCQPFGIKVQSNVLLGMDFHAHLMTTEIIGFLAGDWDATARVIHIKAIFPCRSLPTGQNHVNVEMDPTSELEVRQEIETRNMRIVGWYHSHPTFTPDPSLVDIENQTSYQSLFKDEAMNEEPFVGAIVGPYDERLPGMSSVINWFYISRFPQERGHPKRLLYDLIEDTELPEDEATSWAKLFDEYRDSPERTNFKEPWRQDESETKLQKMLVSLGRRMPWLRDSLLKNKVSTEGVDNTAGADSTTTEQVADPMNQGNPADNGDHTTSNLVSVDDSANATNPVNVDDSTNAANLVNADDSTATTNLVDADDSTATTNLVDADVPTAATNLVNADDPTTATNLVSMDDSTHASDPVTLDDPTDASCSVQVGDAVSMDDPASVDHPATADNIADVRDPVVMDDAMDIVIEEQEGISEENVVTDSDQALEMNEAIAPESVEEDGSPMEGVVPTEDEQAQHSPDETDSDLEIEHSLVRSLSNQSTESASRAFVGLGGLINDPFLIRVEQELGSWEPVTGQELLSV